MLRTPCASRLFGSFLLVSVVGALAGCDGCGEVSDAPAGEGAPSQEATSTPEGSGFETFSGAIAEPVETEVDISDAVALVDGFPVMRSADLEAKIVDLVARYARQPERPETTPEWRNERRRRLVRAAVHDHLMAVHAQANPVEITDDAVEDALREQLEHVFDDERLLERYLHSRGLTREELVAEKRRELAELRLLAERGPIDPSEAQMLEYYENNRERWLEGERTRVRGVTIRLRRNSPADVEASARQRAEAARARIVAGEPFDEVAREVSESHDRLRGGDMGWVVRGRRRELVESGIEQAVFATPPGQLTEVLRTASGYQFFEVIERRPAGPRQLDEVAEIIRQPIQRRMRERLRLEIVSDLERSHDIRYLEENWGLEDE